MKRYIPHIVLTVAALGLLAVHLVVPALKLDAIGLALVLNSCPALAGFCVQDHRISGRGKIEYRELQSVEAKAQKAGLLGTAGAEGTTTDKPAFLEIAPRDPNLALAGLRIELETAT